MLEAGAYARKDNIFICTINNFAQFRRSALSQAPSAAINCAALPATSAAENYRSKHKTNSKRRRGFIYSLRAVHYILAHDSIALYRLKLAQARPTLIWLRNRVK